MEEVELAVQSPLREPFQLPDEPVFVSLIVLLAQMLRWAPATQRALGKLSRSSGRHSWGLLPGRFKLKVQSGIESSVLVKRFQHRSPVP